MTPTLPALVPCRIGHVRRDPVGHRFAHRGLSWLIDVDRPPELRRGLRPLARFDPADHFTAPPAPGDTLRSRLDAHLAGLGVAPPTGRVVALTSPRVAGYVFNPLSVFWCHAADGAVDCVVAEVHNTYGSRHCYLVHPDVGGRAVVDKEFYVSPFNDVDGSYRLWVPTPGDDGRVAIAVTLDRPGLSPFGATLTGRAVPATDRAILRESVRAPLAPWLVALRIRMHGIALWARGLPIVPRPASDRKASR